MARSYNFAKTAKSDVRTHSIHNPPLPSGEEQLVHNDHDKTTILFSSIPTRTIVEYGQLKLEDGVWVWSNEKSN